VHCPNSDERELVEFFNAMKQPGASVLTKQDVHAQLSKYKNYTSSAQKLFDVANHKKSDSMTLEEFLSYGALRTMFVRRLFREFDESNSGSINRHELKKCLEAIHLSPDEVSGGGARVGGVGEGGWGWGCGWEGRGGRHGCTVREVDGKLMGS
jgi:Ca2+-binding EF-hand superfamily protein